MNTKISQKEIGQRITELRKLKGFSQADLAKRLKISRSSLAQIELGNRSVNAIEIQDLAMILGFSLDEFMSKDFAPSDTTEFKPQSKKLTAGERISVPKLQLSKFKNVLLYILEKCAGKPNVGETVLSNYSHKDMPWLATKEGEEINYELAFYRDAPFSVRN